MVTTEQTCCQGLSRSWVLFMNFFVFLSGVVLLGVSIFNATAQGDLVEALGSGGIIGPIVAGVVLLIVAILGCFGVKYRNKFVLIIYVVLSLAMSVAFLGIGSILTFFVKDLNNIEGIESGTISGAVEAQLNDLIIAVFNECCASQFENITRLEFCEVSENKDACFAIEATYAEALERVKNTQVCTLLSNIEIAGVQVVGDPEVVDGACGGGDGVAFKESFTEVVQALIIPIGGLFIAFGSLLLLNTIGTCVVLCSNPQQYFDENDIKEEPAFPRPNTVFVTVPPISKVANETEGVKYVNSQERINKRMTPDDLEF